MTAALDPLGRHRTPRVLREPSRTPTGFRAPRRRREGLSSSVLGTRLDELTGARLLTLRADGHHLTPLGQERVEALSPLDAWSRGRAAETDTTAADGRRRAPRQEPTGFSRRIHGQG
ncbi:transcriptional regulator [Streptomyces griseoviridis]